MNPGDLIAATSRWSNGVWLYRVTRTTEQRAYVELVHGDARYSGPSSGRGDKQWLEKARAIPIRDMDHFATVQKAHADYLRSITDIKATAQAKSRAALERYEAAIA